MQCCYRQKPSNLCLLLAQENDGKRWEGFLRTCLMYSLTASAMCIARRHHHTYSQVISSGPFTPPQHVPSYLHEWFLNNRLGPISAVHMHRSVGPTGHLPAVTRNEFLIDFFFLINGYWWYRWGLAWGASVHACIAMRSVLPDLRVAFWVSENLGALCVRLCLMHCLQLFAANRTGHLLHSVYKRAAFITVYCDTSLLFIFYPTTQ